MKLDDSCPRCGRPYNFPLSQHPKEIRDFRVVKPLDRGFYGAIYRVQHGALGTDYVLKVSPKAVYQYFHKSFEDECRIHREVASGTEHVVKIWDMFEANVSFGRDTIPCYVAQIDFVPNAVWLKEYLERKGRVPAQTIAQIAIDLLRILAEFENRNMRHNDLHDRNILIQQLTQQTRRAEAVDEYIRAIAVDLGSVSAVSKSDTEKHRLGDIHWIAQHLSMMVDGLLRDPTTAEDIDYRLATLLEERVYLLRPEATSQRNSVAENWTEQWINDIRRACEDVSRPWRETFRLKHFNDSYNAQTLEAWFVPHLLVDPDGAWLSRISTPGPQVISGMRGCGKTMLLRALQFHARAAYREKETSQRVISRLKSDGYIGLYVSCTRLLDRLGKRTEKIHEPYARLFVSYAIETLRAVRHLQDIEGTQVPVGYFHELANAVSEYMEGPGDLGQIGSAYELERLLLRMLVSLSRGESKYHLRAHPSVVFPHLAEAIRKCSPIWSSASVLYLFDDVSTRYLQEPCIAELLSELLFQLPLCAFKITTETQTLKLSLQSPGLTAQARIGRDYEVFDLGAEVNSKMKGRKRDGGKGFIGRILQLRAAYYPHHPKHVAPGAILGDASLDSIAEKIASTTASSREKKAVYHGITALAGVCVGDIGDIISIYEMILSRAAGKNYPVGPSAQSECFQRFCSRRLYDLNRRESHLKTFVLSFAEASHQLLVDSYKNKKGRDRRLRQYLNMYVRVTTGDQVKQFQRLRELIDAGVFVLEGGSDTPRTKTRDSNPMQQFKLTYRKLFGLSNYIGLSERDRFELSGKALEQWLDHPENGKAILLRNLGGAMPDDETDEGVGAEEGDDGIEAGGQLQLFSEAIGTVNTNGTGNVPPEIETFLDAKMPKVQVVSGEEIADVSFRAQVLGLGFEQRCLESVRRTLRICRPDTTIVVKYPEKGHASKILELLSNKIGSARQLNYTRLIKKGMAIPEGDILIDVTGLAKPLLFHGVRNALKQNGRVWICHTRAKSYYPLDKAIAPVLEAEKRLDQYDLLREMSKVMTGEKGPYRIDELLYSESDESRRRVLCAFASPKHERLLSLLDERDYNCVELVVPRADTPRGRMARIAADVAARNFPLTKMAEIQTDDLAEIVRFLVERFQYWYVERGYNIEIAMTGSKLQAVASAAVSAALKISHCWYVRPQSFDTKRFTRGVGQTTYFKVSMPEQ